jgi:lactate racemase
MRLTIVFDDISLPLPQMATPDIRQRIIEAVLELAAARASTTSSSIVANALHRRMTAGELKRCVGERVFRSFFPDHLTNHDAEDRDNLLHLGTDRSTARTSRSTAGRRERPHRLRQHQPRRDGRRAQVRARRPGELPQPAPHHNVHTIEHSRSMNDPRHSAMHHSYDAHGAPARRAREVFTIETTLNNDTFPSELGFLNKREWEWSLKDQAAYLAAKRVNELAPAKLRRKIWHSDRRALRVTGVNAGETEAVHERTLANVYRQQLTEIDGQADILVFGLPYICPYNVNSIMNPILVMCLGLGYFFNMYRNKPIVREGGTRSSSTRCRGSSTRSTTRATSTSSTRCSPNTTDPGNDRVEVRAAVRHRPLVHPPVPQQLRLPRRPPLLHVVLGGARAGPPRRRDLRRR